MTSGRAPSAADAVRAPEVPPAPGAGVLIVGYGNPLRSDDGVGPAVAARLVADGRFAGADIRSAHQLAPELAPDASTASLLVLVDAAEDLAPGEVEVRWIDGGPAAGSSLSEQAGPPLTHQLDPVALLVLSRELWGVAPPTVVVAIGPASLEVGECLSPLVEAAAARAVEHVAVLVAAVAG